MEMILLTLLAGACGALIGGTQTFIITGFLGVLLHVIEFAGVDVTFYLNYVLNLFFMPCVIFNGACVATAYAANHYDIKGYHTNRSLTFTNDIKVVLMGSLGGLLGYGLYTIANMIPVDAGAVSVLTVGILCRFLLFKGERINKDRLNHLKTFPIKEISFQIVIGIIISLAMSYFALETKLCTIGFSISALTLIFGLSDPHFPATHHTTLVAGYAVMQTGNILMGVIFGLISHMINYVFCEVFNTDCGTHIDGPAIAIAICSFVLFVFF